MQWPVASQASFCTHTLLVVQIAPTVASVTMLQSPVLGSHDATLHGAGAGQDFGVPTQSPALQVASRTHLSAGVHERPFGLFSATQAPESAAQSPVLHGSSSELQSLGVQLQTPALHVPVDPGGSQQPEAPHSPPVTGWDLHSPVAGRQLTCE